MPEVICSEGGPLPDPGPGSVGQPVVFVDSVGAVHQGVLIDINPTYPQWATVLTTDTKVVLSKPVGDSKVIVPLVTVIQNTPIAEYSATPAPGKWTPVKPNPPL